MINKIIVQNEMLPLSFSSII